MPQLLALCNGKIRGTTGEDQGPRRVPKDSQIAWPPSLTALGLFPHRPRRNHLVGARGREPAFARYSARAPRAPPHPRPTLRWSERGWRRHFLTRGHFGRLARRGEAGRAADKAGRGAAVGGGGRPRPSRPPRRRTWLRPVGPREAGRTCSAPLPSPSRWAPPCSAAALQPRGPLPSLLSGAPQPFTRI